MTEEKTPPRSDTTVSEEAKEGLETFVGDAETPDWLRDIIERPTKIGSPEFQREQGRSTDIPSWLKDVLEGQDLPDDREPPSALSEALSSIPEGNRNISTGDDIPDWLSSMSPLPEDELDRLEEPSPTEEIRPPIPPQADYDAPPSEISLPSETEIDVSDQEFEPPIESDSPVQAKENLAKEIESEEEIKPGSIADWLRSTVDHSEPPDKGEKASQPAVSAKLPDWLTGLAAPAEEPFGSSADENASEDLDLDELPEWLKDLQSKTPGLAPAEPLLPPDSLEDEPDTQDVKQPSIDQSSEKMLTDWLGSATGPLDEKQLPRSGKTGELPGTGPLVPPELPDWLAAVSTPDKGGELPEWLMDEVEEPPTEPLTERIPDDIKETLEEPLLSELIERPTAPTDAETIPPEKTPFMDGSLPEWLEKTGGSDEGLEPSLEIPDWLIQAEPIGEDRIISNDRVAQIDAVGLVQAEIPEWLNALKPESLLDQDQSSPKESVEQQIEKGGPLDGLRGALVATMAIAEQPTAKTLPKFVVTEQQQAQEQILTRIVHSTIDSEPYVTDPRRTRGLMERFVIPLLIFFVVLLTTLPQFKQALSFSGGQRVNTPAIDDAFILLDRLPDSALVIVAFDYAPAYSGELDPIAHVMVRHLMQQHAKIFALSTVPAGAQIGQSTLEKLAEDYNYKYGVDYLNLGYLPGGAVGLQAFAASPWKIFSGSDYQGRLASVQNAAISMGFSDSLAGTNTILVLAPDRDDLVGWLEQVQPFPGIDASIVAGISAGMEPWAQPYYYSNQLSGIVSGVPGAAQYELQMDTLQARKAVDLQNGQTVGLVVIILFVILGLIWSTLVGLIGGKRTHD